MQTTVVKTQMQNIQSINNNETNGETYFLLNDVARLLNYKDSASHLLRRCDKTKGTILSTIPTKGGYQKARFVSIEKLIEIVNKSTRPEAKEIQKLFHRTIAELVTNGNNDKPKNTKITIQTTPIEQVSDKQDNHILLENTEQMSKLLQPIMQDILDPHIAALHHKSDAMIELCSSVFKILHDSIKKNRVLSAEKQKSFKLNQKLSQTIIQSQTRKVKKLNLPTLSNLFGLHIEDCIDELISAGFISTAAKTNGQNLLSIKINDIFIKQGYCISTIKPNTNYAYHQVIFNTAGIRKLHKHFKIQQSLAELIPNLI